MKTLNKQEIKTLTGAQIAVETLKRLGVDCIFGYPGGVVLDIYDELFKQNDIKHYLVRHEQAAVHAAEGYARISGKCGVVLVTSGPGAANTVSGIANAYLDGYPLIVLTGQVFKHLIGTDAFQEINIVDITKSCTKASYQVTDIKTLESTLTDAYHCAMTGKKGPVVVDLAKNIFGEKFQFPKPFKYDEFTKEIDTFKLEEILENIKNSKHPVIVTGGGVNHAKAKTELEKFAKILNIPVVSTMMGLGSFNADYTNYLGMIGIFGQNSANETLRNSDLILSLGARFNDRITGCFKKGELSRKFIQIDINDKELSRVIPAYIAMQADLKEFLKTFNNLLEKENYLPQHNQWLEEVIKYTKLNKKRIPISNKLQSFEVIQTIYEATKDLNIPITTEVGQHQMWTAQNYKFNYCGQFITSGGSGTMGFGFPAAIGASIALNSKPVICISGDGSFQMNEQELATCADYKLPVKIFILNNGYLGMVRQLQQKGCEGRYAETKISNPDFIKLAQAYGIKAERVSNINELKSAVKRAFSVNETYITDIIIEPFEVV